MTTHHLDFNFNSHQIIDISPLISPHLSVFPGDTPFQRQILMDFKLDHHLLLSSMSTTLHLGAHADAPNHYHADGEGIDQRDLSYYLGTCQVIHLTKEMKSRREGEGKLRLYPQDLEKNNIKIKAKRVLFFTNSFPDINQWNDDFLALSPELISFLHQQGVILVGLDTPSVDPAQSKNLETHQMIYQCKMSILEGLVLQHVPEGLYQLIALPLKIKEADASPVRAILIKI